MQTIEVTRRLTSPIEHVFEALADHARYDRIPGITSSKLVTPGTQEKNGVGAIREIGVRGAWFREEITAFERPHRLAYRIVKARPPIDHQGGEVTLRSVDGGTEVVWTSTFRIPIPVLGRLLAPIAARRMRGLFGNGLEAIDRLPR